MANGHTPRTPGIAEAVLPEIPTLQHDADLIEESPRTTLVEVTSGGTTRELELRPVSAPRLGQDGYGRHMEQTFENIDDNFRIIGNRDFVKGDKGYSLRSVSVYMIDPTTGLFTSDGIQMLKAVLSINGVDGSPLDGCVGSTKDQVIDTLEGMDVSVRKIAGTSLVDYINKECVINRIEVYDPSNDADFEVVGSTNDIVFKDARFVHVIDCRDDTYSSKYDYTCTIHLAIIEHNGVYEVGYQVLQNYPTLYYDNTQGVFCWKVFGVPSGIIAQGPQGINGSKAAIHIVEGEWDDIDRLPSLSEASTIQILRVLDDGVWRNASTVDMEGWLGEACIMFATRHTTGENNSEGTPVYPFAFASTISRFGSNGYGAYCDQANSIQMDQDAVLIRSAFLGISYSDSSLLHALFVPIKENVTLNNTPVHAIWSAPVGSQEDGAKYELHITPFSSYDKISETGAKLSTTPAPSSEDTSNTRLNVLDENDRRYKPADDVTRLQLDYPQVIIAGPIANGVPTSALGVGTSYLDPLYDFNSTTQRALEVPRIKVGQGGIVQIGANNTASSNNNLGKLVVSSIWSSLDGIAKTEEGTTSPLRLIATNGKMYLGSKSLGTSQTTYMYDFANILGPACKFELRENNDDESTSTDINSITDYSSIRFWTNKDSSTNISLYGTKGNGSSINLFDPRKRSSAGPGGTTTKTEMGGFTATQSQDVLSLDFVRRRQTSSICPNPSKIDISNTNDIHITGKELVETASGVPYMGNGEINLHPADLTSNTSWTTASKLVKRIQSIWTPPQASESKNFYLNLSDVKDSSSVGHQYDGYYERTLTVTDGGSNTLLPGIMSGEMKSFNLTVNFNIDLLRTGGATLIYNVYCATTMSIYFIDPNGSSTKVFTTSKSDWGSYNGWGDYRRSQSWSWNVSVPAKTLLSDYTIRTWSVRPKLRVAVSIYSVGCTYGWGSAPEDYFSKVTSITSSDSNKKIISLTNSSQTGSIDRKMAELGSDHLSLGIDAKNNISIFTGTDTDSGYARNKLSGIVLSIPQIKVKPSGGSLQPAKPGMILITSADLFKMVYGTYPDDSGGVSIDSSKIKNVSDITKNSPMEPGIIYMLD